MKLLAAASLGFLAAIPLTGCARIAEAPNPAASPHALRGRVLHPQGAAVAGARVRLASVEPRSATIEPISATTDSLGEFGIPQAAPGRWLLVASASGYGACSSDVFAVDPGDAAPAPLQELVLERACRIEGRILDDQGQPVGGATVSVEGLSLPNVDGSRIVASSDASGAFRIDGIPARLPSLRGRVEHREFHELTFDWASLAGDGVLRPRRAPSIEVRAHDLEGAPVKIQYVVFGANRWSSKLRGSREEVIRPWDSEFVNVISDAHWKICASWIPPQPRTTRTLFVVSTDGWRSDTVSFDSMSSHESFDLEVPVGSRRFAERFDVSRASPTSRLAEIAEPAPGPASTDVVGKVTFRGRPVPSVAVSIRTAPVPGADEKILASATTGQSGSFRLLRPEAAGAAKVTAQHAFSKQWLELPAPSNPPKIMSFELLGAEVRGRVVDRAGRGARAPVRLSSPAGVLEATSTSDPDGYYRFVGVPNGPWIVSIDAPHGEWDYDPTELRAPAAWGYARSGRIDVRDGTDIAVPDLVVSAGATLRFTLITAKGTPPPQGLLVSVRTDIEEVLPAGRFVTHVHATHGGAITRLPAGQAQIELAGPEGARWRLHSPNSVELRAGETTSIALVVSPR